VFDPEFVGRGDPAAGALPSTRRSRDQEHDVAVKPFAAPPRRTQVSLVSPPDQLAIELDRSTFEVIAKLVEQRFRFERRVSAQWPDRKVRFTDQTAKLLSVATRQRDFEGVDHMIGGR